MASAISALTTPAPTTPPSDPSASGKTPWDRAFGTGGPMDMSGIDLSWLTSPKEAVNAAVTTTLGYAGLTLLGVLLVAIGAFVLLRSGD